MIPDEAPCSRCGNPTVNRDRSGPLCVECGDRERDTDTLTPAERARYRAEEERLARLPDGVTYRRVGTRHEYRQGYRWVSFDRLSDTSNGLQAWVEAGAGGRIPDSAARHDLMSSRVVPTLVSELGADWADMVKAARYDVIARHLEGDPAVTLADVGQEPQDSGMLVAPLVAASGATLLVAVGGTGKSLLALAVAAAVASGSPAWLGVRPARSGPVVYLDWEDDAAAHAARLGALAAGAGEAAPRGIDYMTMRQPLAKAVEPVRRHVDQVGAELVIVDSVMLARGGDAFGPESTTNLFGALREIGRPALLADHKSRDAARTGRAGAYGSVVGENSARIMWEVRGRFDGPDGFTLRLEQTKNNRSRRAEPIAYRFDITSDGDRMTSTRIRPTSRIPDPDTAADASLTDRIAAALADSPHPQTVRELVDVLGASENQVRARLSQHTDRFENVAPTGPGRWKLRSAGGASIHLLPDLPDPW